MDTFEHYQLLKDNQGKPIELGQGGMGVTYKAFETSLHCHWALKVIGAPQTPNDPVAGVCWGDAEQLSAWLTRKEGRVYVTPAEHGGPNF